jgi:hypothetical protein
MGIFETGNEFGRQRERIFAAVRVYAAAYPFPCGPAPKVQHCRLRCAAGWKRIASAAFHFFFLDPASRSRMSDANEKTAKMHQEVSSPFPFLLATGTVDFSFWPCLDADLALPIWHYALHSMFCVFSVKNYLNIN